MGDAAHAGLLHSDSPAARSKTRICLKDDMLLLTSYNEQQRPDYQTKDDEDSLSPPLSSFYLWDVAYLVALLDLEDRNNSTRRDNQLGQKDLYSDRDASGLIQRRKCQRLSSQAARVMTCKW
jgi:hypothetical protein